MMSETHTHIIEMVERWIRHELPILNRGTEAHGDVRFILSSCRVRVEAIAHAASGVRDPETAMHLLQLLAFAVSSTERHLRAAGAVPGTGVEALEATAVLVYLGEVAGHMPRDSHETYWLRNQGERPLLFLGASEEARLLRIMGETHHRQSVSAGMLRPICAGDVRVAERMAIDSIELAAQYHDDITVSLHTMLAPSPHRMGAPFELTTMMLRPYLAAYPIGIQTYPGPDPANLPGAMEMETLIGQRSGWCDQLRERMPFLMRETQTRIEAATKLPSLTARVIEAAELTEERMAAMSDEQLAAHLERQPWMRDVLAAYAHLVNAVETSASYFSVIEEQLRPAQPQPASIVSGTKTLAQRERYDTQPQVLPFRGTGSAARRLMKARSNG